MTADEHAHVPSADLLWEESWYFDFATADGGLAGYARLTLRPAEGVAWWWSAVVGDDVPFVLVREHDVALPKPGSFEIRASGLWAEPVCETPGEHWSLGLEAFGVGFDDPVEAYGAERGDIVGLGFDLEWEAGGDLITGPGAGRYAQPGEVHGDVLVGRRKFGIEARGLWQHAWGRRDWWGTGWSWAGGRFVEPLPLDGETLLVGAVHHAPLKVESSRLARAVVRAPDGGDLIWAERLQPASRPTG